MRIDAGIDWLGRIRREEVMRLFLNPFAEEAGTMLLAAQKCWEGRVRGRQIAEVGQKLLDDAYRNRKQALGWADFAIDPDMIPFPENNTFPPEGPKVGPLLANIQERRRYLPRFGGEFAKERGIETLQNDQATFRLARTALRLVETCIEIARRQCRWLEERRLDAGGVETRKRFIENLEDEFEMLTELRCFAEPDPAISEDALKALLHAAALRTCAQLSYTIASLTSYRGKRFVEDRVARVKQSAFGLDWYDISGEYLERYDALCRNFAYDQRAGLPKEIGQILFQVMDIGLPATTLTDGGSLYSYNTVEEIRRAERIILSLLTMLLTSFDLHDELQPLSRLASSKRMELTGPRIALPR